MLNPHFLKKISGKSVQLPPPRSFVPTGTKRRRQTARTTWLQSVVHKCAAYSVNGFRLPETLSALAGSGLSGTTFKAFASTALNCSFVRASAFAIKLSMIAPRSISRLVRALRSSSFSFWISCLRSFSSCRICSSTLRRFWVVVFLMVVSSFRK